MMSYRKLNMLKRVAELTPEEALEFAVLGLDPNELFPLLVSHFPGLKIELPDSLSAVDEFIALHEEYEEEHEDDGPF